MIPNEGAKPTRPLCEQPGNVKRGLADIVRGGEFFGCSIAPRRADREYSIVTTRFDIVNAIADYHRLGPFETQRSNDVMDEIAFVGELS
jgi:hypothetical protein